jgi:hypothetical protein
MPQEFLDCRFLPFPSTAICLRNFFLVTGSRAGSEVYRVNHASIRLVEIYTVPTKTTTKDLV